MEIWKKIEGYENYSVSNKGRVRNDKYKRYLNPQNSNGYLVVRLYNDSNNKIFKVHRLVAIAFLPNPENLSDVNHKDEDKSNNHIDNLEWCTHKYNMKYGTIICRKIKNDPNTKSVLVDGKLFNTIKSAAYYIGCSGPALSWKLREGISEFRGHSISYT